MKRHKFIAWFGFLLTAIVSFGAIALTVSPLQGQAVDPVDALSAITSLLDALAIALVGAVVSANLKKNPIGWLMLTAGLAVAVQSLLNAFALIAYSTGTESVRGGIWAVWVVEWVWIIPVSTLTLLLHLFPTGKFLSPRWRWVAFVSIALCTLVLPPLAFSRQLSVFFARGELNLANPVGLFTFADWVYPLIFLPFITAIGGALCSMILRFVRARGVERQQMKWFLYAAAVFVTCIVLTFYTTAPIYQDLVNIVALGLPVAIGIAILRYRLFDIDIIIRRTVTYTIVAALLAAVYFASVVLLQEAFAAVTGEHAEVTTVLSTLAIAALFVPLRNRVQSTIDRRFNRQKYDAQLVLTKFAQNMRDETDLDKLTAELLNVVNETMQPKRVSVWLKATKEGRRQTKV